VAGSKYSWTSYRSLVPLIVGVVGTFFAIYVEKRWVKYPTIPFNIFTNRSSAMGYLQVFIHAVAILCVVYYLREQITSFYMKESRTHSFFSGIFPGSQGSRAYSIWHRYSPFSTLTHLRASFDLLLMSGK
jgi:hypothetical protein